MDMYLSMIDPVKSQSIDAELPFYCAFSFPAVLQTLGSDNWALLKPTFEALASDMQVQYTCSQSPIGIIPLFSIIMYLSLSFVSLSFCFSLSLFLSLYLSLPLSFFSLSPCQWKIRRVLAFSLHEIAVILGQDKTVADLLSVVDEYCTKDVDDVKFGVLNHLADFFEVSRLVILWVWFDIL